MKNINASLILLIAQTARCVGFGASIGDAIALIALCGLYGYLQLLKSKESEPLNDKVAKDLDEVKSAIAAIKVGRTIGRI